MPTQASSTRMRRILGSFSKCIKGGCSINFCTSGGKYCDRGCRHHPESTHPNPTRRCYGRAGERRFDRAQLLAKLKRHADMDPAVIVRRAALELHRKVNRGKRVPWLRLATNGSLPGPRKASEAFQRELRNLAAFCREHGIPTHFPVESSAKADFYRNILGDLAVVRETAQTCERFLLAEGPVAFTGGQVNQTRLERLAESERLARLRARLSGRYCLVCPAISHSFRTGKASEKIKCGLCKACSLPQFDMVYPLH